jgi:hypothetical protein
MNKGESALPSWVPRFEAGDPFLKAWSSEECVNERRRVMLRSRAGTFGTVTKLHDSVTDYLFFKQNAFLDTLPPFLQGLAKATVGSPTRAVLVEVIESSITKQFVELKSLWIGFQFKKAAFTLVTISPRLIGSSPHFKMD